MLMTVVAEVAAMFKGMHSCRVPESVAIANEPGTARSTISRLFTRKNGDCSLSGSSACPKCCGNLRQKVLELVFAVLLLNVRLSCVIYLVTIVFCRFCCRVFTCSRHSAQAVTLPGEKAALIAAQKDPLNLSGAPAILGVPALAYCYNNMSKLLAIITSFI